MAERGGEELGLGYGGSAIDMEGECQQEELQVGEPRPALCLRTAGRRQIGERGTRAGAGRAWVVGGLSPLGLAFLPQRWFFFYVSIFSIERTR